MSRLFLPSFFTFNTPSFVHSVSSLQMNFSGKIVTNDGLDISSNMPTCINSEGDDTCDFQIKYYDNDSAGVLWAEKILLMLS